MKKKVYLIYPPSAVMNREDRCQQPTKELLVIPPLPPSDLMYLAAIARRSGLEAKIKDYSLKNETAEDFLNDIKDFKPDYIVINTTSPTLDSDLKTLYIAKKEIPNVLTIAKGAHFLTFNTEILDKYKALDCIIRGEAELTLEEVLQEKPLNEILGLTYRENCVAKNNPDRPFNENLDDLPFPARDLVDNDLFRRPDNNKKQAVIKVSRGCPFHCFFCLATPVSGKKVRYRSAENIIAEIKECVEKYQIKDFLFWSDIFNLDKKWTMDFCEKLIDSKLKITWSANTRADTCDDEMAKLMHKSGCRLVSIGVESGSQEMLEKMGKKTTLEQVRQTVKTFKNNRIRIYNYFVIGLPWETEQTTEETIKFAIELNSDFISFYTATALPGSRFYKYAQENELFERNEELYKSAYYYPSVKTHYLSKDRVFELHKSAIKRYYLRPAFIIQALGNIRTLAELKNYFIAGFSILLK